ncbi:MAG: hypothetical protein FJZ57_08075, partial [Chlamydiae bacterium]|nr:hypothetical protein [Chlamydiota bacterium]
NHFALKYKILIKANQIAYEELKKLQSFEVGCVRSVLNLECCRITSKYFYLQFFLLSTRVFT